MKYFLTLCFCALCFMTVNAQTYQLKVTLTDGFNHPISNASVMLKRHNIGAEEVANGTYVFRKLSTGKYTLYISKLGYKPITKTVNIDR